QQIIELLRYLALAANQQGRQSLAEQYCQEALKLCEDLQYRAELPSVLYTLTQLCHMRGDHDLARQYGERCLAQFINTGDRKSQSVVLEYLVRIYLAVGELDLAQKVSSQSLALSQELHDDWGLVYALRSEGRVYIQAHRPTDARRVWFEALRR